MGKSIFIKLFICSIFIFVLLSSFCIPTSHALGDIFSSGSKFLKEGKNIDETINTQALKETSDTIYNTLLAIAIMVAVVVAMVLGIQFMVASADEKAKVKEALMPFVVGCIVVFGSFTIWKVVVKMGNNAEKSTAAGIVYLDPDARVCTCGYGLTLPGDGRLPDECLGCGAEIIVKGSQ